MNLIEIIEKSKKELALTLAFISSLSFSNCFDKAHVYVNEKINTQNDKSKQERYITTLYPDYLLPRRWNEEYRIKHDYDKDLYKK